MSQQRPRIGVVGSSNVDVVTYVERMPAWGETIAAPRFEMNFGGKGANQAVAAAKLGADVVMVSKVGDDALGANVLANFAALGVDARHVGRVADQSTGTATILVNPAGENFILIVKGANGDLTPADVEAAAADLATCDLILLQLEVPLETVTAALEFGRRRGVKTVLNPAPAVTTLDRAMVRLASFVAPNETELAILTGLPVGSEDEVARAAQRLLADGVETVIVTLGARGALVASPAGLRRVPPAKVEAVDTTGAGDAFLGAFARYYAGRVGLDAALEKATRYAADSVTKRGAQKSYATEAEFERLVRRD
ncbi:ribokinase [Roseiarcus fermentans]|uniref:Ribokinase n=1 Tax=Roseiarcus fermentans TaxID=1473586 RepID=A0A366EJG4_9HYPH|nr:ribokinase [Roseiarcus fermentans]RBP02562.1 ribokinase [Roseiarcus fermentans]